MSDTENVPTEEPTEVMEDHEETERENGTTCLYTNDDEIRTVFSDPVNFNVKHPLFTSWTLWFDNPGKKANTASWSQNLKELITFDSVEEFWGVYNNVVKASELSAGSNYHLFKKGIKPMWEDPANEQGGKWVIQFPRNKTGDDINDLWLFTMLACIGESFDHADEVCGAVVSVRKIFYRISLWTRTSNKEICEPLGRQMKLTLNLNPNQQLEFQPHSDSIKSGSHSKERLVV
ncbi:24784_t:CDS:2 [Dentiscutata erythropus]|uniref:24784_t:CDS:1 n=1 Tax=Dentiscutata erythropus TaxID=1348616 RepID=A0A9N9BNT0_9GLOM|nr:24784_t:CDS:2 [Dentiscutata erythropus]